MHDRLARQMIGQRASGRLRTGRLDGLDHDRSCGQALGLVDLQRLDGEFELFDPTVQLLGRSAELGPLQPRKLEAQLLDQRVGLHGILRHADDHPLQRRDVVRQGGRIESHRRSLGPCPAEPPRSSSASAGPESPCRTHPASRGRSVRNGARQSIPSNSMASCAGVSAAAAPPVVGQTNRPFSSRLANRHRPCPSHQSTLINRPWRPRKMKA